MILEVSSGVDGSLARGTPSCAMAASISCEAVKACLDVCNKVVSDYELEGEAGLVGFREQVRGSLRGDCFGDRGVWTPSY
ncbi:hypothetical protein CEXT_405051 [Caerostris extrusa]|uniref:Uncharacterized protein n=1 Tax=Caerostris extrusa TaxID=172846 RepID=A0AAV4V4J6_CAEEX|nr:hypothetical protein CEXT_405051 [Caerostris extrusa]